MHSIRIQYELHLLIKFNGKFWKDNLIELNDNIIEEAADNGFYLVYQNPNSQILISIANKFDLVTSHLEAGVLSKMWHRLPLKQLFMHVELRKRINEICEGKSNDTDEIAFTILSIKFVQFGFQYLFRQAKFTFTEGRSTNNAKN